MISPARKIPDAQWEHHKTAIRALYIDQDSTLDETVQVMSDLHGFHATRAQFVRKLRVWGFDKNIKTDDWRRAVKTRDSNAGTAGTELVINGRSINPKRVKKRLSRSDFRTNTTTLSTPLATGGGGDARRSTPEILHDTPLLTAVRCRDNQSVQGLLSFGARVSLDPTSPHHRPFVTAINQGYARILQSLLGACREDDPVQGYNGLLRRAVSCLSLESTKTLLDFGADITSIRGLPCFEKMEEPRRRKAMQLIAALVDAGADINGYSEDEGTEPFLCTAIRCENFALVSFLLRRGARPAKFPSTSGVSSPLHLLMRACDAIFATEALEALISHGADIRGYENMSSIQLAPSSGVFLNEMEAMMSDLVDCQRPGVYAFRATPVQAACLCAKERMLAMLIKAGADANAPASPEGGFTALQIVCLRGFTSMFDMLIEFGADVNAPAAEGFGLTALQASILGGHDELTEKLLDLGSHVDAPASESVGLTALQAAVITGNHVLTQRLLDAGADVNAPAASVTGKTALQAAACAGDVTTVRVLLEAGADVNASPCRSEGLTALQWAAAGGNVELMMLLLSRGANVYALSLEEMPRTVLEIAAEGGHTEIVNLLLDEIASFGEEG